MSNLLNQNDDADSLRSDLAALKADVAGLLEHLKSRASTTLDETLKSPAAAMQKISDSVEDCSAASVKELPEIIDKHPLAVVLATFTLGFWGDACCGAKL